MSFVLMIAALASGADASAAGVQVIRGNEISQARVEQASLNPRAVELVDSNPVIKGWALRQYDSNHDGWLTVYEAQPAVKAFEDIADENRDGSVTVSEYQAAIDYLRSRY